MVALGTHGHSCHLWFSVFGCQLTCHGQHVMVCTFMCVQPTSLKPTSAQANECPTLPSLLVTSATPFSSNLDSCFQPSSQLVYFSGSPHRSFGVRLASVGECLWIECVRPYIWLCAADVHPHSTIVNMAYPSSSIAPSRPMISQAGTTYRQAQFASAPGCHTCLHWCCWIGYGLFPASVGECSFVGKCFHPSLP